MLHPICSIAVLAPVVVAAPQDGEFPQDVRGFCGQVTGVVTARHDDGSFSLRVALVTRVWRGNEATNLEWLFGRTIRVGPRWLEGDDGRWRASPLHAAFIRRLAVPEDLRLEIRHAERDRFAILELSEPQRERARGGDGAARRLPAGARGFCGMVGGVVLAHRDDGTLAFEVRDVVEVWKGSDAAHPADLRGAVIRLGPMLLEDRGPEGERRPYGPHAAFLRTLTAGQDLRIEIRHAEGDRFRILELSPAQREAARGKR